MASHYVQAARGIRRVSAVIAVAAPATPENLYLISPGGTVARTVILRKIWAYSIVGNCVVQIGTGLAPVFAQIIPPLLVVNNFDNQWAEDQIPEVEVNANLTVQSDIALVQVQVEVEEIGT